jgi:alanyl-tRNA synthetase
MEFNRKADGSLEKLPAKHVDTGIWTFVWYYKEKHLIMIRMFYTTYWKVEQITGLKYTTNDVILNASEESEEQNKTNIAIRVVVDHVRAVAFAIADGQPVKHRCRICIRRILRRAIRYGFTFWTPKNFR